MDNLDSDNVSILTEGIENIPVNIVEKQEILIDSSREVKESFVKKLTELAENFAKSCRTDNKSYGYEDSFEYGAQKKGCSDREYYDGIVFNEDGFKETTSDLDIDELHEWLNNKIAELEKEQAEEKNEAETEKERENPEDEEVSEITPGGN